MSSSNADVAVKSNRTRADGYESSCSSEATDLTKDDAVGGLLAGPVVRLQKSSETRVCNTGTNR